MSTDGRTDMVKPVYSLQLRCGGGIIKVYFNLPNDIEED